MTPGAMICPIFGHQQCLEKCNLGKDHIVEQLKSKKVSRLEKLEVKIYQNEWST